MCRGIILVKNISLDRNAGPLLLQCVYQVTSENLKNMKSNTQIYSFKNKPPALKRRTFIRNVKCFNYSSFVNKNSKENVFYLRIVVGIHRVGLRHGMAQQHTPSVHKHDKHVLPSGPADPGLLWGWG